MKKLVTIVLLGLTACQPDNPQPNTTNNGSGSGNTSDTTSTGNNGGTDTTSTGGGTSGIVYCTGTPTEVVDVTNPTTGKTWMDRNLGASQAATSSTDAAAYGDLYQWGRGTDGHQCRNSLTTSTLSSTDQPGQPGHGDFITSGPGNYDWRSPQNDNLWQGVNGTNNPCPIGYRLPTYAELEAERLSWISDDADGAFDSPLKLPMAGNRDVINGLPGTVGTAGGYWSSTVGTHAYCLYFFSSTAFMYDNFRAIGYSVRCLKD